MNEKASITSLMSAYGRAFHAKTSEAPVFNDTAAERLFYDGEYEKMSGYILSGMDFFAPEKKGTFENESEALLYLVNTQIAPTPLARAVFCEESLKTAVLTGTEQYVILGAGMDTFALRERWFTEKYKVFEADHPLTQADKISRIRNGGFDMPENLIFVPIDFGKDSLKEKLLRSGFDRRKKTFFSWLGVSYYLSAEEIGKMLDDIAYLSSDGSTLVFDCADEGLFTSGKRRVKNMISLAAAGGEPMKTCFSYVDLESLLEKYGFLIYELLTDDEINRRYFANRTDGLCAFEDIMFITAVIKK
ncbi:MAG: class I SAM-dependent methyltransferase [Eubacteriales bacterium]